MIENGGRLRLLAGVYSAYELAQSALARGIALEQTATGLAGKELLEYDPIYSGSSPWRILPAFDHPEEPARCLVTGTGLTHKKSAENRQAMHASAQAAPVTDSMRMYQSGIEGGRPGAGKIGVAPEWFYKGCGTILRAHGEPLEVPEFGLDGGEEAEVAGVYVVDNSGAPRRAGFVLANEFSDHKFEQKNYLYLAHSKLRTCAIGPELVIGSEFTSARGKTRIVRDGSTFWEGAFSTGESNMSHTIANLEHHHFKYPAHRRPGDAHIHFFGADVFSFGAGIELKDGDVMELELEGFGRPLRNPISISDSKEEFVAVLPL
jgi:hypothetical protein